MGKFDGLMVGDEVIISGYGFKANPIIGIIEKITPSGLFRIDGILFNVDGWERSGRSMHRRWFRVGTQEEIEQIKRNAFTKRISQKVVENAENFTYEQAAAIAKSLDWI